MLRSLCVILYVEKHSAIVDFFMRAEHSQDILHQSLSVERNNQQRERIIYKESTNKKEVKIFTERKQF